MGKRGRPRKNPLPEDNDETTSTVGNEDVAIEGIAPSTFDIEEEFDNLGGRESDPYHEDSARYGRNADDPAGGIGLGYGDW